MFLLMVRVTDPLMPRAMFGVLNTVLYFPSGAVYPQQGFPQWMHVHRGGRSVHLLGARVQEPAAQEHRLRGDWRRPRVSRGVLGGRDDRGDDAVQEDAMSRWLARRSRAKARRRARSRRCERLEGSGSAARGCEARRPSRAEARDGGSDEGGRASAARSRARQAPLAIRISRRASGCSSRRRRCLPPTASRRSRFATSARPPAPTLRRSTITSAARPDSTSRCCAAPSR